MGIEEKITGKTYKTNVLKVTLTEIKKIHKKDGWNFNWLEEFKKEGHEVYKLVIRGETKIQGLISFEVIHTEGYNTIEMHLIENAPCNFGNQKLFEDVACNLVAFACKQSFEHGFQGIVSFTAKTQLIKYYSKKLGAQVIFGRNRMAIFTEASKKLIDLYYDE